MKNLFEKTKIKNMTMKNRFVRGALYEKLADEKGHMTPELFNVYEELAKGGVSTIITGYAYITEDEQPNPCMMGIYDDSFIEEYKELTDMAHKNDVNIVLQVVYGGSQTGLVPPSKNILGPSAIENKVSKVTPKEATKEDIKNLVKSFADAALRAKKAGFDGVEIHAAHGYLLSQFLDSYYNQRTDEYGGSIENKARIIFEVYEATRKSVGENFPIWIKINSQDYTEKGLTQEESMYVCKKLSDLGIDAIEISGPTPELNPNMLNSLTTLRGKLTSSKDKESFFKEYAMKLSKEIDTPIILIGGHRHLDIVEDILNNSNVQYFSLARPLTCEPDLINRWASADTSKAKCVSCNQCFKTYGHRCIFNIKR